MLPILLWTLFSQTLSVPDKLTINVPATSNPYLAGMPNGTKARIGDSAPQQSPVLVQRTLAHAVAVRIQRRRRY